MDGREYAPLTLEKPAFDKYKGPKITPTRTLIHVQMDHKAPDRGLLLAPKKVSKEKLQARLAQVKVLAVGPEVQDVEVGQVLLLKQHDFSGIKRFEILPDGTALYERAAVVAVVEST